MNNRWKYILPILLLLGCTIFSQEKVSKLTAPASPAASIIGLQQSAVLTPKSFQALETAFYSNFYNKDTGLSLPNDFALEFTPYWATNHSLTFDEWVNPKDIFNGQILRNSSISIASTKKFMLEDSTLTNSIAIGYRTSIFIGNANDEKKVSEFKMENEHKSTIISSFIANSNAIFSKIHTDFYKEGIKKIIKTNIDSLEINNADLPGFLKDHNDFISKIKNGNKDKILAEAKKFIEKEKVGNKKEYLKYVAEALNTEDESVKEKYIAEFNTRLAKRIKLELPKVNAVKLADAITAKAGKIPFDNKKENLFADSLLSVIYKEIGYDEMYDGFKKYLTQRQGWSIDLAFAAYLNFPTNNFEFSVSPKQSIWFSPAYRFADDLSFLKVLLVFRAEFYNTDYYKKYFPKAKYYQKNYDYGLAINGEFEKFTFQLEALGRYSNSYINAGVDLNGDKLYKIETGCDFQYAGSVSYRLSDELVLTYTLGKQFKPEINPGNTLLSLLSMNFGFGAPTAKDITVKEK